MAKAKKGSKAKKLNVAKLKAPIACTNNNKKDSPNKNKPKIDKKSIPLNNQLSINEISISLDDAKYEILDDIPNVNEPQDALIDLSEFSFDKNVPDVIFDEDGSSFFPCKHCCRAFSSVGDLDEHLKTCEVALRETSPKSNKENLKRKNNNNNVSKAKKSKAEAEKAMKSEAKVPKLAMEGEISVITTDSVSENINNVSADIRNLVLQNIKKVLEKFQITIIAPKEGPIIVQTAASATQPALQITSRNLDDTSVEIKTIPLENECIKAGFKLPDIAEILENNFGSNRPRRKIEVDPLKSGLNLKAIVDETETINEMVIDEIELDGCIVLEDLDIHICKQCGSVYHSLEDLINHDKYEHRHCRKRYPVGELSKYDTQFRAAKDFICPICNKNVRNLAAWPRHLQSHNEKPAFACKICNRTFTRNDHCQNHQRRHANVNEDNVITIDL